MKRVPLERDEFSAFGGLIKMNNYKQMNKLLLILIFTSLSAFGQFKDDGLNQPKVKEGIVDQSSEFAFGFLNSENFLMRHSFSLSYSSFGGQGMSLGSYTNSMFYRLMDNLNIQLDVSLVHSPYSTFGEAFQKNISGLYISNAAINYRPWKDVSIHLQYRNTPYSFGYYSPFYRMYSPFMNPGPGFNTSTNSDEKDF
jgi:hypothetical protein